MTKTYRVADMHCPACVMLLEGLEDRLPGIHRICASYKKQTLVVDFDQHVISEEQILAAIRELGYTPEAIQNK